MAETEAKTALKQAGTALQEPGTALKQAGTALKNEKVGEVVSTKMQKTIVVEVSRRVPHPLYKRIIGKRKKFYAHDEEGTAKLGDEVRIVECRPLSKLKRWRLKDIVRRAPQVAAQPKDLDVKV